jgi:hypothetical protein
LSEEEDAPCKQQGKRRTHLTLGYVILMNYAAPMETVVRGDSSNG